MTEKYAEFDKPTFSVDKYTKEVTKECVGGPELLQRKKELQAYYDHTSATLKKSVYANYKQFIEAAREISHLESEMYQLSHILIQQRNILSSIGDEKSTGNIETDDENEKPTSGKSNDPDSSPATKAVKELVQNFNGNLEGKTFLNEGNLWELDPNDYRSLQKVYFLLFNDILLVCKDKHDKRLEFVAEYDPKKIAVINIKDLDGVKNAINIITPDGSKIYQCISPTVKTEWIEQFEVAFRFDRQKKSKKNNESSSASKTKPTKRNAPGVPNKENRRSQESSVSDLNSPSLENPSNVKVIEKPGPEWIQVASEEVQTLIALRYFEEAQNLIARSLEYLEKDKSFSKANEIAGKIKNQESNLSNVLIQELSNCKCRNLQVALRSSKRLVRILVEMGRARQACSTLLKVCTVAIRTSQREARRNNAETSELFFCDLAQVACEFLLAFEQQTACVSALVVWCNSELQYFATQLIKHYLTKGSQLDSIAKCLEGVRKPCAKLCEIGLDLSYHLEGLLRAPLEQLIEECRIRLLETIGRTDESWQPYNLQTKTNLRKLLHDLDVLGLNLKARTTGDTWINLTQSTVLFSRQYLQLAEHCAVVAKNEILSQKCEILLRDMILAQYGLKPVSGLSVDPNFVIKNKNYLIEELLPVTIEKFHKISGNKADLLMGLHKQLKQQQAPIPKQRSVYQTDVF